MENDDIRTLVSRLSRRHKSGGKVIERAAILAEGADCAAVEGWIIAHDGQPEAKPTPRAQGGLYGERLTPTADGRPPARYVLPAEALAAGS